MEDLPPVAAEMADQPQAARVAKAPQAPDQEQAEVAASPVPQALSEEAAAAAAGSGDQATQRGLAATAAHKAFGLEVTVQVAAVEAPAATTMAAAFPGTPVTVALTAAAVVALATHLPLETVAPVAKASS